MPVQEHKPPILLVDDQPKNLQALSTLFKDMDVDCLNATSGDEALKIAIRQDLALILLDVQMPGMDGYETASILRSAQETQHIPIIFVSAAFQEPQHMFQGYEVGAIDYLLKPLNPHILKSKVRVFLELYQKNKALEQTIEQLSLSQRRLVKILDLAEEAILTIDSKGAINFYNLHAQNLLGFDSNEVLGKPLSLLIPDEQMLALDELIESKTTSSVEVAVRQKNKQALLVDTNILTINLGDEVHIALILREMLPDQKSSPVNDAAKPVLQITDNGVLKSAHPSPSKAVLYQDLAQERQRIHALAEAFEGAIQFINKGGQELIQELRSVDQVLDGVNGYIAQDHQTDQFAQLVVNAMCLSVNYWETTTGKRKVELAEESQLWTVHLDKSTFRTKTLDRYFSLDTLPKKPRFKEVLATAGYVLSHCPAPCDTAQASIYSALKMAHLNLLKLQRANAG